MKAIAIATLSLAFVAFPLCAKAAGVDYSVDWPVIHLHGTFTLDVPPQFGSYFATNASGTYGGLSGSFPTHWSGVQLSAQPDFAQITFLWDQGWTSYAVNPAYVGRSLPWTSAEEAWADLRTRGIADGVNIAVVPEPSTLALVLIGVLVLAGSRRRQRSS